ncbi:hypothetical protein [Halarchaeum nitratireducens]|uniref:Uncharacterized protein n=1 Tax=Halarchaeum nitratireducens TaxID=489913 RepID=A0A830G932_9EURY|nr:MULTISPECIES: hypothetical protein [Halarchaeum]MBP2249810.1 hypothetical protein [Halarchaeum solikamskense]GGN10422.1 hypothetical protein GCM10009021_07820 [Halarchaeum nitratireducens]
MRLKLAAIALGIVVVASAFGASAFTTATVDRDASLNVATDSGGLVGLQAGDSSLVTTSSDQLAIDVTTGTATGINPDSTLTIGNATSPAFTITNNFGNAHTFNVTYDMNSDPDTNTDNVQFELINNSGGTVATVSEDTSYEGELAAEETLDVVVTVDSTGQTSNDSLTGTLNVTA